MRAAPDDALLAGYAVGDPDAAAAFIHPQVLSALDVAAGGPDGSPASIAETKLEVGRVRVALAGLSEGQRRALLLAAVCGRTAKEISEAEGIPLGTAKTRIRSGLLKLRDNLNRQREGGGE
jgi:RNA polymerase sigma-70 factor (ECF subfamily)